MNGYLAESVGAGRVHYGTLLSQIPAGGGQRLWGQNWERHICTGHKNILY